MCLSPIQIKRYYPALGCYGVDTVKCGKCIECLRRKQSDYAYISKRQALESGNIVFLTLTYRNDALPMGAVYEVYDRENDCVIDRSKPVFLREDVAPSVREEYWNLSPVKVLDNGQVSRELGWQLEVPVDYAYPLEEEEDVYKECTFTKGQFVHLVKDRKIVYSDKYNRSVGTGYDVRLVTTPSLRRSDVKNWLKSSRESYFREFGYRPSFKYLETGEYGEQTSRPHFHILLYGCSQKEADFFANRWRSQYGRVDVEYVRPRGSDTIEQAHEKVSRYIAKYLCKGEFELSFVSDGFVEKPRRVSSRRLGSDNLDDLRAYILAFDVFGKYDPDRPPKIVVNNIDILLDRRYEYVRKPSNGDIVKVRIPDFIYQKCLSKTYGLSKEALRDLGFSSKGDSSFVYRVSHQRSTLSRLIAKAQKLRAEARLVERVNSVKDNLSVGYSFSDFRESFKTVSRLEEASRSQSASSYRKKLRSFYNQSLF